MKKPRTKFNPLDYINKKFNKWTILSFEKDVINKQGNVVRMARAKCDCGNIQVRQFGLIKNGIGKGCKKCATYTGFKKNISRHPLYRTYAGMKQRCYDKTNGAYRWYGGRGIRICKRWLNSFNNFVKDMGERPAGKTKSGFPKFTLDRINVDGDYKPSNCRWATIKQQSTNKRYSKMLTISNLAVKTGYSRERVRQLARSGKLDKHIRSRLDDRTVFKSSAIGYLMFSRSPQINHKQF